MPLCMASDVTFKLNPKSVADFGATLNRYAEVVKKDFAYIINKKAFYIARGAARLTPRADYRKFAAELGLKLGTVKKGKREGRPTMNP